MYFPALRWKFNARDFKQLSDLKLFDLYSRDLKDGVRDKLFEFAFCDLFFTFAIRTLTSPEKDMLSLKLTGSTMVPQIER